MSGLIAAGAHDGIEFREDPRHLLLIEPQAAVFRRLQENFSGHPHAKLVRTALGAENGTATLNLASFDQSASLLQPARHLDLMPKIQFVGTEQVPLTTLDEVVALSGHFYDELVLDVQGYELQVLKGATRTLQDLTQIKCEVNTDEVFTGCPLLDDIDRFLSDFGLRRTHLDLLGDGVWGDAIYSR